MILNTTAQIAARLPVITAEVPIRDRNWQVRAVQNEESLLDALEDLQLMPYGFLLWESAIGLSRHLTAAQVKGKHVLELGCGVGLPGLIAADLGGDVWQTDHQPGVLTLARENARINNVSGIHQFTADWRDWRHSDRYDVLIGADILYERAMHFHLRQIFEQNLAPGGTLIVSDPGRQQSVEFMSDLEKSGWSISMETLPVSLAHEGPDARVVEVIVLTCTKASQG